MNATELKAAQRSLEQTIQDFNKAKDERNIAGLATAAHAFARLHEDLGDDLLIDAVTNTCLLIADCGDKQTAISVATSDALWERALNTTQTNDKHLFKSAFECLTSLTVKALAKGDLENALTALALLDAPRVTDDPALRTHLAGLYATSAAIPLNHRNAPVMRDMAEGVGRLTEPLDDLNDYAVDTLLSATVYALRKKEFGEAVSCAQLASQIAKAETSPDSLYREAIVETLVNVYKTCAAEPTANNPINYAKETLGTAYTILASMPEKRDAVTGDLLGWARQAVDDNKIEQALETATLVFSHDGQHHIDARSPHRHTIFALMGNIAGKALKTIESPENALNLVFSAMILAKDVDPFFNNSDAKTKMFAHYSRLLLNSARAALNHNVPNMAHVMAVLAVDMAVLAVDMVRGKANAAPDTLSTASTLCLDAAVKQMPNSKELGYALYSLDKAGHYATTPDQQSHVMHRLFQFAGEALAEKNPYLVIRAMRWIRDDNGQYQSPDHADQYQKYAREILSYANQMQDAPSSLPPLNPIEQMLASAYEDNDSFNARKKIGEMLTNFVETMAEMPEETPATCQRDNKVLTPSGTTPTGEFAPK